MYFDSQTIYAEHAQRLDAAKRLADKLYTQASAHGPSRILEVFKYGADRAFEHNDPSIMQMVGSFQRIPVTIEEFLESPDFIGGVEISIWPKVREDIISVCTDFVSGKEQVKEYLDMGAIGTGKTTKAWVVQAYQLYFWTCMKRPKALYGIAEATPVVISMASSNVATTRDVLFKPFRDIITNMPYFRRYTQWNKDRTSTLDFSDGLRVEPVNATTQGIIGRAVLSAIVDEANYMSVVRGSSKAIRGNGRNGVYDQADEFIRSVKLRQKSRFTSKIPVPGVLSLLSSAKSMEDFLTKRAEEITSSNEPGTRIFRHKQYEVQPAGRFKKERFRLIVGTAEYPTRILEPTDQPGVDYPADAHIESVPEDYRYDFVHRPEDAVRDVLGLPTVNMSPFFTQRQKIVQASERWLSKGFGNPVGRDVVDLAEHGMPVIIPGNLSPDVTTPRFAHVDLSRNKDSCGVAVGYVEDWVMVQISHDLFERLPYIVIELAVGIQPSKARELDPAEVRNWVLALSADHGIPIHRMTYDGFDSRESIVALRSVGVRSGVISLDTSNIGYNLTKRALYQDRLDYPPNEILKRELVQLDIDHTTGKVDHPSIGSKDIADAVAGVVTSIMGSRMYRGQVYYCDGNGKRVARHALQKRGLREEILEAPAEDD